jgi:hypothetical protein
MSAIVISDEDENWFTNSRAWSILVDRARRRLDGANLEIFDNHVDIIGVDFTCIEANQRRQVAQWLLHPVEELCGSSAAEEGWDTEVSRNHLRALATMLRRMA